MLLSFSSLSSSRHQRNFVIIAESHYRSISIKHLGCQKWRPRLTVQAMLLSVVVVLLSVLADGCQALENWDQYEIVWQDEFDFMNFSNWQYEVNCWGGGNNEFQLYSNDSANSFIKDGKIFIKPSLLSDGINPSTGEPFGDEFLANGTLDVTALYGTCTNQDNGGCYRTGAAGDIPPVMSARLRTFQKFSMTFGRVVIRAKMSVGDWLWPAIWMFPEQSVYGGWPRSGEIDIVESRGNRDLVQNGEGIGIRKVGSTLHWGPAWNVNQWAKTHMTKNNDSSNYGDEFHTYIFDWSTNGLRFFVDDEENAVLDVPYPLIDENPTWKGFWEWGKPWQQGVTNPWSDGSNMAPFDQAFHFIMNVAVGGTNGYFPDGADNRGGAPKPWSNSDPYLTAMQKFYVDRDNWKPTWDTEGDDNGMQIDYIRVYQQRSTGTDSHSEPSRATCRTYTTIFVIRNLVMLLFFIFCI